MKSLPLVILQLRNRGYQNHEIPSIQSCNWSLFQGLCSMIPATIAADAGRKPREESGHNVGFNRQGGTCGPCEDGRLLSETGTNSFKKGKLEASLDFIRQRSVDIDSVDYNLLLQGCVSRKSLLDGRRLHAGMIRTGGALGVYQGNRLVDMYIKCGSLKDARQVFDKMPIRDISSWNTITTGYVKCGCIGNARQLFDKMPERDRVSWNGMIAGYAQHSGFETALKLFGQMQCAGVELDQCTLCSVLCACAGLPVREQGKQDTPDICVERRLSTCFGKCGRQA